MKILKKIAIGVMLTIGFLMACNENPAAPWWSSFVGAGLMGCGAWWGGAFKKQEDDEKEWEDW